MKFEKDVFSEYKAVNECSYVVIYFDVNGWLLTHANISRGIC